MSIWEAIIQGIVQGLTEFLPVSSSGHLTITQHIFETDDNSGSNNLFFSVMLHIGTLAAVLAVYIRLVIRLLKSFGLMIKDIFNRKFKWNEMNGERNFVVMLIIGLLPLFLLFLPIPGTDMKLRDLADMFSKSGYFIVVGISLLATSVLLFIGDQKNKKTTELYKKRGINKKYGAGRRRYNTKDALTVGITQCFAALFPGLSRSGSTLAASEIRGINKQMALDYSFLLGTPAIIAAAILEGKEALAPADGMPIELSWGAVVVGMLVSGIVGFFAIKIFRWLLSTDKMYIFIGYTAVVGALIVIISIIELSTGHNIFTGSTLKF